MTDIFVTGGGVTSLRARGADYMSNRDYPRACQVYAELVESSDRTINDCENLIICYYSLQRYDRVVTEFNKYSSWYYPKFKMILFAYFSSCVIECSCNLRYLKLIEGFPSEGVSERHLKLGSKIFHSLADKGYIKDAYAFKRSAAKLLSRVVPFRASPFVSYQVIAANVFLGYFDRAAKIASEAPADYEWGSLKKYYDQVSIFCEICMGSHALGDQYDARERLAEFGMAHGSGKGYVEAEKYFRKLVSGKSVAIVGPADTGQQLKLEVDSYDVVVRTNVFSENDYFLDGSRIGSRVDVSYYTAATSAIRKNDLIEFGSVSEAVFVFRNNASVREFGRDNLRLQDRVISESICNFMPVFRSMHAVQRIAWDLLKYGPSKLKVFNVNFFVGEMYHDKYKPRGRAPGLKSVGIQHDPLQSFMFSKKLEQLGLIAFDDVASEVLKMSELEYVYYLEERFGLAWRSCETNDNYKG